MGTLIAGECTAFGFSGLYKTRNGSYVAVHGWVGHTIDETQKPMIGREDAINYDAMGNCLLYIDEFERYYDNVSDLTQFDLMHSQNNATSPIYGIEIKGCPVCERKIAVGGVTEARELENRLSLEKAEELEEVDRTIAVEVFEPIEETEETTILPPELL